MPETITFLTVLRKGKSPGARQGLLKLERKPETGLTCDKIQRGLRQSELAAIAINHKRN
jgi:hypothetical protein